MLVRLEAVFASPTHRGEIGDILDLPQELGERLIRERFAIEVQPGDLRPKPPANPLFIEGRHDGIGAADDDWTDPMEMGCRAQNAAFTARRRARGLPS